MPWRCGDDDLVRLDLVGEGLDRVAKEPLAVDAEEKIGHKLVVNGRKWSRTHWILTPSLPWMIFLTLWFSLMMSLRGLAIALKSAIFEY